MRGRNPGGPFIWAVGAVLACLAGCDDAPNPNFEQSVPDQQAARTRDEYASLNSIPRSYRYLQVEPKQRAAQASQMLLSYRATYESMLKRLDAAPKVAGAVDVAATCRATFAEVSAFTADVTGQAPPATNATAIFDRLAACRDRAIASETTGNEEPLTVLAALKRFASGAMVLVAVTTVSQGDEAVGLDLWRRGEELAVKDKPGFKVTPNMFSR